MQSVRNQVFPPRTLTARLLFIVIAAILPAAIVGVLLVGYDYFDRERARLERDALSTARAMAAAVDAELVGARAALLALATSPFLAAGNFGAFHGQARQVLKDQILDAIVLTDASGRQLMNTRLEFGQSLPAAGDPGGLLRMFQREAPVVSNVYVGRLTQRHQVGIAVPVRHGGRILYSLNGGMSPERLAPLFDESRLPPGWVAGVVDSAGNVVTRSRDAQRFVGGPASAEMRRWAREASEGTFEGPNLEGAATLSVFSRAPISGWTVAIGIPQRELATHLLVSLGRLFIVSFIVLASSLGIAVVLVRRFARPVT